MSQDLYPAKQNGDVTMETVVWSLRTCLEDLQAEARLGSGSLLVVGASTSEIMGQRIGTATSVQVGQTVVDTVLEFTRQVGCDAVFQCCEHLNRALVMPQSVALQRGYVEVQAIPVPGAGGAVAACAYFTMTNPCLVESAVADAGIDIGDTLIGMHLRRVAVPVRGRQKQIGQAHVTMARTRAPLIGGSRAVYDVTEARARLSTGLGAGKAPTASSTGESDCT